MVRSGWRRLAGGDCNRQSRARSQADGEGFHGRRLKQLPPARACHNERHDRTDGDRVMALVEQAPAICNVHAGMVETIIGK